MPAEKQAADLTPQLAASPFPPGEWITAKWVNDRTHGQQFKARSCAHRPTSADGIEKYLSSGTSGRILRADEGYCGAAGSGVLPTAGHGQTVIRSGGLIDRRSRTSRLSLVPVSG